MNVDGDDRIFVQIPAYRDAELPRTLLDLYAKAARPERLRTCVVWQHADDEHLPSNVLALPGLDLIDVPATRSDGPNWARARSQQHFDGERYTLLLDSHHRFSTGWDDALIRMHTDLLAAGSERPLLTAYLPAYDPELDPLGRRKRPYKIYPHSRDQGLLTRLTSFPIPLWNRLVAPIPADFVSLHLVFAAGSFNEDVQFDSSIYFFGDEVVTGLRAFTHGYDLFHPHRVIGWHSYARDSRVGHWTDHPGWERRHQRSLDAMRAIVTGSGPAGLLGRRRSIADYEAHIMTALLEPA